VICKQLVQLFHGDLTVESTKGVGSEFIFTVQLAIDKTKVNINSENVSNNPELARINILLLMKLASSNGRDIIHKLTTSGVRFIDAANDSRALELLLRGVPQKDSTSAPTFFDFILINCNDYMEVNSTLALLQSAATKTHNSQLKFVIITTTTQRYRISCPELCERLFCLVKPLSYSRLLQVLYNPSTPTTSLRSTSPTNKVISEIISVIPRTPAIRPCVLVVEDNLVNQKVIASYLTKKRGIEVTICNNGLEALHSVRSVGPGYFILILMDIFMPEMDGFTAAQEIRKWETEQGVDKYPIIALTANVSKEICEQCTTAGMDGCITKPIDFNKLDVLFKKYVN